MNNPIHHPVAFAVSFAIGIAMSIFGVAYLIDPSHSIAAAAGTFTLVCFFGLIIFTVAWIIGNIGEMVVGLICVANKP